MVMVVHPDTQTRILLRSMLQDQGRKVVTGDSWLDLIGDRSGAAPDIILLDRSLLNPERMDVLSSVHQKWNNAEIVYLPEGLNNPKTRADSMIQLLRHLDRLLAMMPTHELLAASQAGN